MTGKPRVDWQTALASAFSRIASEESNTLSLRDIVVPMSFWGRTVMARNPYRTSSGASEESLIFERSAAAEARKYHEAARKQFPFEDRRLALREFAAEFYKYRLRIHGSATTREIFDALADPDTLLLEMAHDGQLPHLGIVRLVLKAHDIARLDPNAVTLYLVGNHYTAEMRPENLRFGVPLNGTSPDDVKQPPRVPIGKADSYTPFRWLRPPSSRALAVLRDQVDDFVANNLAHEKKMGSRLARKAKERLAKRLDDLFGVLHLSAREVNSFGDWLIRIQHDFFHHMLGREADRILFLPMADLTALVRPELTTLADRGSEVNAIKADVSHYQIAGKEEPYQREPQRSAFWLHCPSCFRRTRQRWQPGEAKDFVCPFCAHRVVLAGDEAWKWVMPDIVGYEVALFRLGLGGWVVGSHAPYHPVIEQTYAQLFQSEMPPKFFLTSVPMFRGIGDPPEGYGRTRLLRALLEMEPPAIATALRTPWDSDPHLRSDLLRAA